MIKDNIRNPATNIEQTTLKQTMGQIIQTTESDSALAPPLSTLTQALKTPSGLLLLASVGIVIVLSLVNPGGKPKLAKSRWAKPREKRRTFHKALRQIKAQQHNKVALAIGTLGDRSAQHFPDCQRSIAVVGAPGSGKTYSVDDPVLISGLLQGMPTILYDFKYPSQAAKIAPIAQHLGYTVNVFAPGFDESSVFNPTDLARNDSDITMLREFVKVFNSNAASNAQRSMSNDGFFTGAGEQLTVGVLALAKTTDFPDLPMAQAILRLPGLPQRLKHAKSLPPHIRVNFDQLMSVEDSEKTAASIIGTALANFNRFMDPILLKAVIGKTSLPLELEGKQLVIIGVKKDVRRSITPLLAGTMHMLISGNVSKPRTTPLIVSIDELPTILLPNLVHWINECREQGVCFIIGFQNLAQLEESYGRAKARSIFGACATKVLFNPGEPESARHFSDYLGEEEIRYTETSRNRSHGKTIVNKQPQRRTRRLMEHSEFLRLGTGTAVILSPGVVNKKQATIPFKCRIQVPATTTRMIAKSEQAWSRLCRLLAARNRRTPPSAQDLQARLQLAEKLLPLPPQHQF